MTVDLEEKIAAQLEAKVRSGRFSSFTEAVHTLLAVAIFEDDHQPSVQELEHLRPLIEEGLADIARGDVAEWDPEEIWAEAERLEKAEQAKKAS